MAAIDWVVFWKLPKNPARAGACSIINAVAPPNSPPAENPCIRRAHRMPTDAKAPMLA